MRIEWKHNGRGILPWEILGKNLWGVRQEQVADIFVRPNVASTEAGIKPEAALELPPVT
jgi:hypothetical protein